MARAEIGRVKAVARHQHHAADPGRGGCAARLGDARHREARRFRREREPFEALHRRHVGIEQVEVWDLARKLISVGEPGERILGRRPRHGERALGERGDAVAFGVVGGHERLPAPDQNA